MAYFPVYHPVADGYQLGSIAPDGRLSDAGAWVRLQNDLRGCSSATKQGDGRGGIFWCLFFAVEKKTLVARLPNTIKNPEADRLRNYSTTFEWNTTSS